MNTHSNVKSWRTLSKGLTRLLEAEGTRDCLSKSFQFINEYVAVDSCAVFKISHDRITGAEHLFTFGRLDDETAEFLAKRYISKGYLDDPIIQTAIRTRSKTRTLPGGKYNEAYRAGFFEKAGIVDKVTSLYYGSAAIYAANFYRIRPKTRFSNVHLSDLERLGPLICQHILRHHRVLSQGQFDRDNLERRVDAIVSDSTLVFSKLSLREKQVCRGLLLGKDENQIAKEQDLSATTIATYRKRLHAKLNIKSKEELFQLALLSL